MQCHCIFVLFFVSDCCKFWGFLNCLKTFFRNLLSPLDKLFLSLMYLLQEILEVLECTVAQAIEKINPEERDELKVSGKNIVKKSAGIKIFSMESLIGCSCMYIFSTMVFL